MSNKVQLYSNGTAVVTKEYEINGEQDISIPVRKSDLADVVSSIHISGNVQLPTPPSYAPVNAVTTKLTIDPSNSVRDMATKLRGAQVSLEVAGRAGAIAGKLVGTQKYSEPTEKGPVERVRLVVLDQGRYVFAEESDVQAIKFTDPQVQAEVDKALELAFQQIKPDSTFVNLTVVPVNGATSARVSYAVPVAAWKIRYQLRLVKDRVELEGQAVVDNDTDDDWTNSIISVITGVPITFDTDLAETRRPKRSRVNVVDDAAAGAVVLEDVLRTAQTKTARTRGLQPMAALASFGAAGPAGARGYAADAESYDSDEGGGLEAVGCAAPVSAQQTQAEVRESGDFSIFTSPDKVNVGSKKSAIIPMFRTALNEAKTVLVYKEANDPKRPFRAVKLKNETTYTLGKGVCEVFQDNDFGGKCILDTTKPGEDVFLIHAKETGVKVNKNRGRVDHSRLALRITDGVVYVENSSRTETTYSISNSKPEAFTLEIEHPRNITDSTSVAEVSEGEVVTAQTPSGWRFTVTIPANGTIVATVAETSIAEAPYNFGQERGGVRWLQTQFIANTPLAKNKAIKKVFDLQEEVESIESKIQKSQQKVNTLKDKQDRLMKLIPSGHKDQADQWRTELGKNENELNTLNNDTIPKLESDREAAIKVVNKAKMELIVNWSSKDEPAAVAK